MSFNNRFLVTIMVSIFISLFIFTGIAGAARIAVLGFESKGISWTDSEEFERQVLRSISENYSSKLADENVIEVVESSRVNEVLEQMEYLSGDRIELSNGIRIARMLESDLFILGSLESLKIVEKDDVTLGPLSYTSIEAEVILNARLFNTQTGELITTYSASASESDTGLELADLRNISIGSEAYTDSAIYKAIDAALVDLVDDTVNQRDMFERKNGIEKTNYIEAEVVEKVGDNLVINKGSEDGIKEEQRGKLERKFELESGDLSAIYLGEVVVSSVDRNNSLILVEEPTDEPDVGDIVKIESDNNIDSDNYIVSDKNGESDNDVVSQQESSEYDAPSSYLKKVETSDFIIYIENITMDNNTVTFHGIANAKNSDTDLTLYLPSNHSFLDHQGERQEVYADQVKIGTSIENARDKITKEILEDYPQTISWKFAGVPDDSDHLSSVTLYFETPAAGEVKITLENVSLAD